MEGLTQRRPSLRRRSALGISLALFVLALPASAGSLEQAKRIYDRLAGVPPSDTLLPTLKGMIDSDSVNGPIAVANAAMQNKAFYNATLKNWITPWTNRDGNKFAPLNDYTATVIGIIRDNDDYRKVLYDDVLYIPNEATYGAYSNTGNSSYAAVEAADADLGQSSVLVKTTQSSKISALSSSPGATAGVITTRAAARAFFIDGTNRAMFRFTLKNHLCNDMEQVQDITRPSDRIRRDVSRSPGGDSRVFMNTCIGCHSGMDPLAQAFAYYNFAYTTGSEDSGQLEYTPGVVQKKYHINENHFIEGYNTPDDHWDNYWRSGPNTAIFGWGAGGGSGSGAKSMAQELANSEAFATCSVKKVFQAVCLRAPAPGDQAQFTTMLNNFKSGYNLKHTFAEAAVYCSN